MNDNEINKNEEVAETKLPFWKKDNATLRIIVRAILLLGCCFAIYIKFFGWPNDKIDAREYLPNKNMKVVIQEYMGSGSQKRPSSNTTIIYAVESPVFVHYEDINKMGNIKTEKGGYIIYDNKANALLDTVIYNSLSKINLNKPKVLFYGDPGKSFNNNNDKNETTSIDKELYTVTTQAGTFKNCVLVKTIAKASKDTFQIETYYAKGFGKVKSVSGANGKVLMQSEIQSYEYLKN